MTSLNPFAYGRLFFNFNAIGESSADGLPLVCLNGGIMTDTGSEDKTHIFTCQDRYPVYAAMGGMRCLLFIRDTEHMRRHRARIAEVKQHLELIRTFTGLLLDFELPEPLYMCCDINTPKSPLCPNQVFLEQIHDPKIINSCVRDGIYLNQLSPTISDLLEKFYCFLQDNGISSQVHMDKYHRMAQCALRWHDKANYVELMRGFREDDSFPAHVPSAVFSSRLLKDMTWTRLNKLFQEQTDKAGVAEFFVKSAMDADGEVNVVLGRDNFYYKARELLREIETKVTRMNRAQLEVQLLVQPRIERSDIDGDLPASVGVTYNIHGIEDIERLVIIGHVYEDAERKTFIGSYMSDHLTRHVLQRTGEEKIMTLMRLFANQGYRGPINLDAVRNTKEEYIFIYDCNPRLGGSFPGLILKDALEQAGLRVQTLLTLGYRGRIIYPDLKAKLEELKGLDLLFTKAGQRGVYIIPSLVRPDSFDLTLINMRMDEIREFISSNLIHSLSDEKKCDLRGIYL